MMNADNWRHACMAGAVGMGAHLLFSLLFMYVFPWCSKRASTKERWQRQPGFLAHQTVALPFMCAAMPAHLHTRPTSQ